MSETELDSLLAEAAEKWARLSVKDSGFDLACQLIRKAYAAAYVSALAGDSE